jgi:uncharacterized protein with HEPN domain
MSKNPRLALEDIVRSIGWIENDIKYVDFRAFKRNRMLMQAVERNIEIISEASRRIPAALRAKHTHIPWQQIAGIGNILRHDYDEVVPTIIWKAVRHDLKSLKKAVQQMLAELSEEA